MLWFLASEAWALVSTCSRPIKIAVDAPNKATSTGAQKNVSGMLYSFFSEFEKQTQCKILWEVVPRARGLHYFQTGIVDLMYAVQTDERDRAGDFISLVEFYPSLIVLKSQLESNTVSEILEQDNLFFNFVRGFDYGPKYHEFIEKLKQKKQMEEVADVDTIVRKMRVGRVHATVMAGTLFLQASEIHHIEDQFAVFSLTNFSKLKAGIYISKQTLNEKDKKNIHDAVLKLASNFNTYKYFQTNYPAWAIKGIHTKDNR
jgi:hypothetical protein